MERYQSGAVYFKALADPSRLAIIDMLSCGELCACNILEKFNFTQPTLSHHMKILCDANLVKGRKEGKWMYYTLREDTFAEMRDYLKQLSGDKEDCICAEETSCCPAAKSEAR